MQMQGQDWTDVIIHKGRTAAPSVNAAIQHGQPVVTEKKREGGTNKPMHHHPVTTAIKLDHETESFEHKHLSHDFKKTLMQARLQKKMSQADLGKTINERANVIADYETGKVVPNPAVVSKLSRSLGVKLNINM
jgi:putative transcription factor